MKERLRSVAIAGILLAAGVPTMAALGWPGADNFVANVESERMSPSSAGQASSVDVPIVFEENRGQTAAEFEFLARGPGYVVFLDPGGATWSLQAVPADDTSPGTDPSATLRMSFVGAGPGSTIEGEDATGGLSHYYRGNDPALWIEGVPHYREVRYAGLYSGIDAVFYGSDGQLEFDFLVSAGADPGVIRWAFDGASSATLAPDGSAVAVVDGREISFEAPVLWQSGAEGREPVEGGFERFDDGAFGFRVGEFDPAKTLVIDPVVYYSTYLGGSLSDGGNRIATDVLGSAYVTGSTISVDFPTNQLGFTGNVDAYATRVDPTGTTLIYSTYLGGTGREFGQGIDVHLADQHAFVTGWTQSADFPIPVTNVWFPTPTGLSSGTVDDAFVVELDAAGAIVQSTFLGGTSDDEVFDIAVDSLGFATVTGGTVSTDYPTTPGVYQPGNSGGWDAFVTKLDHGFVGPVYSTLVGDASGFEAGHGIDLDRLGAAVVTGWITSPTWDDLLLAGQPVYGGGPYDAFVVKLLDDGSGLVYATYLGGVDDDRGYDVDVQVTTGNAFVTGETSSINFPVSPGATQFVFQGATDAFITKMAPATGVWVCSTYLGGSDVDRGRGIAVDDMTGAAWATGTTASSNFPQILPLRPYGGGASDAYLVKLDMLCMPAGTTFPGLSFASYWGGSDTDTGMSVDINTFTPVIGWPVFTGSTSSGDFPVLPPWALNPTPWDPAYNGGGDAWVLRLIP